VLGALDDKIAVNERIALATDELIRLRYSEVCLRVESTVPIASMGALIHDAVSIELLKGHENYIGLEHMPKRNIWLNQWASAASVASGKNRFRRGDILFGKLRPYFHKVGIAFVDGVSSTDILVIRPARDSLRGWLLAALSSDDVVAHASMVGDGTRMPRAKWSDIAGYEVPWPGQDHVEHFGETVDLLVKRIISAFTENRILTELRDTLLPRLMSGELRVREAEEIVGGAL
jgi:hypothetical protein